MRDEDGAVIQEDEEGEKERRQLWKFFWCIVSASPCAAHIYIKAVFLTASIELGYTIFAFFSFDFSFSLFLCV